VATDELVVVVPPGHPWTRRRAHPVTAGELARSALVVREEGSGTLRTLVEALGSQGLELAEPAQSLSSNTAVRVAAMAGAAPAVLSRLAVVDSVAAGDLVVVPVPDLSMRRRLRAVWATGPRPVGYAADFVSVARREG
jgi:DNA-binding transcriptional LysR family regulator